jgi:Flp pilus assembly protein TadD
LTPPNPPVPDGRALRTIARAIELQQKGRLDDAEALYARLLDDDGRDPTVLINAGVLAAARGDTARAIERLARAASIVPDNAIAHANLGFALLNAGRHDDALASLDRALARKPDFAQAHNSRGIALVRLQRRDEARRAFAQALAILPAYAEAALNVGELANRDGDAAAARDAYSRVLAQRPHDAVAATGLAFTDALEGKLDAATRALEAVTRSHPAYAPAWQTLGAVDNWAGRHDAAQAAFDRALALDPAQPEARFGLAFALLARGHYREGFAAFEASRAAIVPHSPAVAALPRWDGATGCEVLVLHGEQGLGDVVQFARFVPTIRSRVGRVVVHLERYWAPLAPLLRTLAGVDAITTDEASLGREAPQRRASILSLPALADARADRLPQPPYLSALPERIAAWRTRVDATGRLKVGLAWSVHARDDHAFVSAHKSPSPDSLAPLLDVDAAAFHSLQPGVAGDPRVFGAHASRISGTGRELQDFGDTAALVASMDVVVTPDTAVAHVAGALGKRVFLLERFHGCWRWRLAATTTPWYPATTIFRQSRFNDWTDAIAKAADALRALASGRHQ